VSFLTSAAKLEALLPPRFSMAGQPVVTVEAQYLTNIDWLAGRGYNLVAVRFPAEYPGEAGTMVGELLTVVWENRTEPIITGREELGWPKVYGEIPDLWRDKDTNRVKGSVAWDGFTFLEFAIQDLREEPVSEAPVPTARLMLKYIPRTADWGCADVCYATRSPGASNRRVLRRCSGSGKIRFLAATWEELPTLAHIVNPLVDLEVLKTVDAGITDAVGGKDFRDHQILH
jgi:hypothetical protein